MSKDKSTVAFVFVGVVGGAFAALAGALVSGYFNYRGNLVTTTANLVKLAGDQATPDYARVLSLAVMLQRDMVEPDILFEAAYRMEDELNTRVMTPMFYLAGKNRLRVDSPLGYVQSEGNTFYPSADGYRISGWALSRWKIKQILLFAPGYPVVDTVRLGLPRPDVAALFPGLSSFESRMESGFAYEIPKQLVVGKHIHLTIRLFDDHFHYRDILAREVYFAP